MTNEMKLDLIFKELDEKINKAWANGSYSGKEANKWKK